MDEAAETSDGFSDWEQIQVPTRSTDSTPLEEQDMVATSEDDNNNNNNNNNNKSQHQHDLSVFPPRHHEGLEITAESTDDEELEVNSSVASTRSSTIAGAGDKAKAKANNSGPFKKANEIGKILMNNGILKSLGAKVRCFMAFGWGVWSVGAVGGVVAALFVTLVYAKVRKWRAKDKEEKIKDQFMFLIQEKDQKINQLLLQIAQMNELLSARRCVPVVRIT